MPDAKSFRFLIFADARTEKKLLNSPICKTKFSEGVRLLLSSYCKAINEQEGKVGNLFQQNTKAISLSDDNESSGLRNNINDPLACFHFIHQNPVKTALVKKIEDWQFSSFIEYAGIGDFGLCNQSLTKRLLNISTKDFQKDSYTLITGNQSEKILY